MQITTPAGFEQFAAEVGDPARQCRLSDSGPVDPAALGHAATRHAIEILGPPPRQLSDLGLPSVGRATAGR